MKLENFGIENDRDNEERSRRMLNITRDTGEFLNVLVSAVKAKNILEIGTSNGYSTLWLAEAAHREKGHVTTVEASEYKNRIANENFLASGLSSLITQIQSDAGGYLKKVQSNLVDFLFLDSERSEYVNLWPEINRILMNSATLVIDNAISHADELTTFFALIIDSAEFETCTVQVGKGEFFAIKNASS